MCWWRKSKKKRNKKRTMKRGEMLLKDLIECCDGKSNPIKFFSADEICKATDNFNKSNHVYKINNFYKWYSGKNENHHKILIKKTPHRFYFHEKVNVCRDIAISSMVSGHKNFLKLVGCCLEFEDPTVMVYDGVKKHYILHDLREQPWKRRIKIAEDIATALTYLHTAFPRPFVYRCLSLKNILLDEDGVAKLTYFPYCVSIPEGETFVKVDDIPGSACYLDKKCYQSLVVSEETDVFAIGMMMQMLLMGKERYDKFLYNYEFRIRLTKFVEEQRMYEIVDPDMGEISEEELSQMKALLILTQRCIGCRGEVPKMVEVAKELKKIQRSLTKELKKI